MDGAWSEVAEKAVRGLGGDQADSLPGVLVLTTFWMLLSSCSSCSSLLYDGCNLSATVHVFHQIERR